MKNIASLWEAMGDLADEDVPLVLNKLFLLYEEKLKRNPDDKEAEDFFDILSTSMAQVNECNLNRR